MLYLANKLRYILYKILYSAKLLIKYLYSFSIKIYIYILVKAYAASAKLLYYAEESVFIEYSYNTKTFYVYILSRYVIIEF